MGLLEKRAIKEFQDNSFKKLTAEINTLAGFDIEFDVKWETLAVEEYAHLYDEGFTKVYFTPILNAFKEITSDDMGKQALKDTLLKISIKNENDIHYGDAAYSYENKTLTIDHKPMTNIDNIEERSTALASFLMKKM